MSVFFFSLTFCKSPSSSMHLGKISQSSERELVAVINKVIIAWLFGDWGRNFRDLDVLQVQEAELHLHVEKSVHV